MNAQYLMKKLRVWSVTQDIFWYKDNFFVIPLDFVKI